MGDLRCFEVGAEQRSREQQRSERQRIREIAEEDDACNISVHTGHQLALNYQVHN
jgi:hypothetical protein